MSVPENPQAFPCLDNDGYVLSMRDPGMTLRDWFAGRTFAAMIGTPDPYAQYTVQELAQIAFASADALLATRQGDK